MSCGAPSTSALSCAGEAWGNNSERLEDKLSTSLGSGEIVDLNFLPKRCTFVLRHEVESIIVSWVAWFENRKDGNVYLRSQNGWWLAGGVFLYFLWLASFLDSLCLQLSISIIGCDIWGDTSLFFFDLELFRNLRGTDKQLVFPWWSSPLVFTVERIKCAICAQNQQLDVGATKRYVYVDLRSAERPKTFCCWVRRLSRLV